MRLYLIRRIYTKFGETEEQVGEFAAITADSVQDVIDRNLWLKARLPSLDCGTPKRPTIGIRYEIYEAVAVRLGDLVFNDSGNLEFVD